MVFGVPDFDSGKALPYKDSMFQPAEVRETGEIVRPLVTLEVTPEGKKLIWLVTDTKERVKGVLGDVAEFQKNIQRLRPDDGTRLSEQPIGTIAVSPMLKNAGFP
ncbi:MAG TPA: hypothetical protein PK765_05350 [bacterium]|nr:hypothetical protein [bacterium]